MPDVPSLRTTRTVFMGTPGLAIPALEALQRAGAPIVGVVTQPDKPAGRGRTVVAPPVKAWAEAHGVLVFQPKGLKRPENRVLLADLHPELLVVVAYGKLLPKEVLDLLRYGAVNVHFSLLPKYRGPAPVPAAILAGDAETGVTIMKLDAGMDQGPILAQERVALAPDDTTATLLPKLAELGARLLAPTLDQYLSGELSPAPQDERRALVCPMLRKENGLIDWTAPAEHIARMVRAYDPWPRTYTSWEGKRLIIRRAAARDYHMSDAGGAPGAVLWGPAGVTVATGAGALVLQEVQREGHAALPIHAFLRGAPQFIGSALGLPFPVAEPVSALPGTAQTPRA